MSHVAKSIITGTIIAIVLLLIAVFSIHASLKEVRTNLYTAKQDMRAMGKSFNEQTASWKNETDSLRHRLDVAEGIIEILDNSIDGDKKRKSRVEKTILAIKNTLPGQGNPNAGCRAKPTPGEMLRIASAVVDMSDRYGVPSSLVLGIIRQESVFCNAAVSPVGAKGYMQLMPDTAQECRIEIGANLKTYRGRDNIHLGTYYISKMLTDFHGDINLAVRAYNGGPTHVKKANAGMTSTHICRDKNDEVLYATNYYCETEGYARKVLAFKEEYESMGLN
jgi:hypothetical protein